MPASQALQEQPATRLPRTLQVLCRRDPSRDRQDDRVRFEGYVFLWPDGRPLSVGFDALCQAGQRLLGLRRQLEGCSERLVEMLCFPLEEREADLTRLPGARVRRFFVERHGRQGRLHFLDGTPTAILFDLDRDEELILDFIGLPTLAEGQRQWLDLAARLPPAR